MAVAFLEFTATRIADSSARNAVSISSANNLPFSVAAMRVCNPDRSPVKSLPGKPLRLSGDVSRIFETWSPPSKIALVGKLIALATESRHSTAIRLPPPAEWKEVYANTPSGLRDSAVRLTGQQQRAAAARARFAAQKFGGYCGSYTSTRATPVVLFTPRTIAV
jgi:hypothetical protein